MNWSIYTADRTTHLKIVVVGLAAALLIAVIGIAAHNLNLGTDILTAQAPTVIKAGGPVVFTDRDGPRSATRPLSSPRSDFKPGSPSARRICGAFFCDIAKSVTNRRQGRTCASFAREFSRGFARRACCCGRSQPRAAPPGDADYQAKLAQYLRAHDAYDVEATAYWDAVSRQAPHPQRQAPRTMSRSRSPITC